MKILRWLLFALWVLLGVAFLCDFANLHPSHVSFARRSLWHSFLGLGPSFATHLIAAALAVSIAAALAPSHRRLAAWIAVAVALILSPSSHAWFACLTALTGTVAGCALVLYVVYRRSPTRPASPATGP